MPPAHTGLGPGWVLTQLLHSLGCGEIEQPQLGSAAGQGQQALQWHQLARQRFRRPAQTQGVDAFAHQARLRQGWVARCHQQRQLIGIPQQQHPLQQGQRRDRLAITEANGSSLLQIRQRSQVVASTSGTNRSPEQQLQRLWPTQLQRFWPVAPFAGLWQESNAAVTSSRGFSR